MESTGSSPSDVQKMRTGIENAASGHGVDGRVILGIIIEESSGNVAVATTWNVDGVPTAGLMQAQGCPGFPGQANLSQVRWGVLFLLLIFLVFFSPGKENPIGLWRGPSCPLSLIQANSFRNSRTRSTV